MQTFLNARKTGFAQIYERGKDVVNMIDSKSGANVVKTIFTHVREYIRSSPCLPTIKYHICHMFAYL